LRWNWRINSASAKRFERLTLVQVVRQVLPESEGPHQSPNVSLRFVVSRECTHHTVMMPPKVTRLVPGLRT
jgi:hypothetical protein